MKTRLTRIALVSLLTTALSLPATGAAFADNGNHHTPPSPVPAPSPSPSVSPSPAPDTARARAQGESEGGRDGAREGHDQDRGTHDGWEAGRKDGYREGFGRCEKEARQANYDAGFQQGVTTGQSRGQNEGANAGQKQGQDEGTSAGVRDGDADADQLALQNANQPGRQKGYAQANQSDAAARGQVDGVAAGDQAAQSDAVARDYAGARKAYYDARYAEPVQSQDQFSQSSTAAQASPSAARPTPTIAEALLNQLKLFAFTPGLAAGNQDGGSSTGAQARPDNRYYRPNPTYGTTAENQAYDEGYRAGYDAGFERAYAENFNIAYPQVKQQGIDHGCQDARNRDYAQAREQGNQDGFNHVYPDAFKQARDIAYRAAYQAAYDANRASARQSSYPGYYAKHFEEARAAAYQERTNALYQDAYATAKSGKYNEVYPGYAAEQARRGKADEVADFAKRPVRLLEASVDATASGLFEPGVPLHVTVKLRNFAAADIAASAVQISVAVVDGDATVTVPHQILAHDLRPQSLTTVTDAIEFRLNEGAIGQNSRIRVSVTFKGLDIGTQDLDLTAQYQLDTALAEAPVLSEGLARKIKVRLTNRSQVESAPAVVTLQAGADVELASGGQMSVEPIAAGASQLIEFTAIAHASGTSEKLALSVATTISGGRQIGWLANTREVPLLNDYRVDLGQNLDALRRAGVTRAQYTITNLNSRLALKSLQLKVRVLGESAGDFVVMGPNPQYLHPLLNGRSLSFVVPVLAKANNGGGTLEIEVQEDGRTVVVHRATF